MEKQTLENRRKSSMYTVPYTLEDLKLAKEVINNVNLDLSLSTRKNYYYFEYEAFFWRQNISESISKFLLYEI